MLPLLLNCAIVGDGRVASVIIEEWNTVALLKDEIKKKCASITVPATDLELFIATTKTGGAWLSDDDPTALELERGRIHPDIQTLIDGEKMRSTKTLEHWLFDKLEMPRPSTDQVHVLVVVPGSTRFSASLHQPHPARKKRWAELNEVLNRNTKAKINAAGESPTAYSRVSFNDVDRIMKARRYEQPSKTIDDDKIIDTLHAYLLLLTKAFGEIVTGKEAKRLHFIVPILASVCGLFDGKVRILAEETVAGKRVHGDGAFEFVIESGSKRVCIVEAKRDDFQQGLAQAYVGCEVLADVEGLSKVYSIVTNFKEWYFSRSLDDSIERYDATIEMENDIPSRTSVKRIAEKIYAMLSEDD